MASIDYSDYLGHLRSESRRFREVLATCDPHGPGPGLPRLGRRRPALAPRRGAVVLGQHDPHPPRRRRRGRPGPGAARLLRRPARRLRRLLRRPGRRARAGRPGRAGVVVVRRADGGVHVPAAGARGADPPARRRADRGRRHAARQPPCPPTACSSASTSCTAGARRGASSAGSPTTSGSTAPTPATGSGCRSAASSAPIPDDGQPYDEDDISVVADPGTDADAVVEGPAAALNAWLWRRGDDSEVTVHGDRGIYDHFREAINHPIN